MAARAPCPDEGWAESYPQFSCESFQVNNKKRELGEETISLGDTFVVFIEDAGAGEQESLTR